jgi:small subunit ribosomal protein S2
MTPMTQDNLDVLFEQGAHFGYSRSRRHPSAASFIYGNKERNDIFDLTKTEECLEKAKEFVATLARSSKTVLFVGGKHEAAAALKAAAERAEVPYVSGRWIGGTLTNFDEIKKRIARLEQLVNDRDRGEREMYTKRERLMMDREIEELTVRFGGLISLSALPAAIFAVDTRHEDKAVREANQLGIPVVGLLNSDCDFRLVQYPIPANDSVVKSIRYFVDEITKAYMEGKSHANSAKTKEQNAQKAGEEQR